MITYIEDVDDYLIEDILMTSYVEDWEGVDDLLCACGSVLCEDVIMTYLHPHAGLMARSTTMSSRSVMHSCILTSEFFCKLHAHYQ